MANNKHHHVRRLFDVALELPPGARQAFLDSKCGDDADLKQRVLAMLAALDDEHFATAPGSTPRAPTTPTGPVASEHAPLQEGPGSHIGPYKLLQQIGEGGFGAVFMAEQEKPVARRVALKIIKLGMDTRQVVARFEQERQALAMMDHPHIARVLDAGATATGRPYFVMELCKGDPIVEYCDKNNLTIGERLELMAQVCHAVQHAHGKGIIHRDLKPSNVLVGTQDGKPHAKVIDFGIAKATSQKLTEKTLFTEHQQVIGTLQYMSPEQAEGSLDIDTRTDVYSLGVLLYELLTGSTPFDKQTLKNATYGEIQRMIREVEPNKPSTRLDDSRETLASIAAHRRVEPRRLGVLVRGELDWIVMKALEKDRTRRYETANGLANDLRRYLNGEDVQAAPPSAGYRLRKLMRRNKALVSAIGAVAAALLVGVIGFWWQAMVAGEQRDRALTAETESKARADQLAMVADFQAGMLEQIDPATSGRQLTDDVLARFTAALAKTNATEAERMAQVRTFTEQWRTVNATDAARELIDRTILAPAIATIDQKFHDQPLLDAQLRQVLAGLYQKLGLFAAAMPLQSSALATRKRVLGDDHASTLQSAFAMGGLLLEWGKLAEAEPVIRDSLEARRRVLGKNHQETLASLDLMSVLLGYQGHWPQAEAFAREVLAERTVVLGPTHQDTVASMSTLASCLQHQGKFEEAEQCFRDAVEKSRGAAGTGQLSLLNNLGTLLQERNKLAEAETCFRELLQSRRQASGEEHPDTLVTMGNLGFVLRAQGKLGEAEPLLRESLEKRRRVLGEDHPNTMFSLNDMGELLEAEGKLAEAEPFYREALARRRRVLGETHHLTAGSFRYLVALSMQRDQLAEAEALVRSRVQALQREVGAEHESVLAMTDELGGLLLRQSKMPDAEQVLGAALPVSQRVLGEAHVITIDMGNGLLAALLNQNKLAEAEQLMRAALLARRAALGAEHIATLFAMNKLIDALAGQGKSSDAEVLAREELATRHKVQGDENLEAVNAQNQLGVLLQQQGKCGEAEPLLREALRLRRKLLPPDHADILASVHNMAVVLQDLGKLAEAEPFAREEVAMLRRARGEEAPDTLMAIGNLAAWCNAAGRLAEAETLVRELLEKAPRTYGKDHEFTRQTRGFLGSLLMAENRCAEAEACFRELLQAVRRLLGEDHPESIQALGMVGVALQRQKKPADAEPLLRDAVAKSQHVFGAEHPQTLTSIVNLGTVLQTQQKHAEAVALLTPIIELVRKTFATEGTLWIAVMLRTLGSARAGLAKAPAEFAAATADLLEAHAIYQKNPGPIATDARIYLRALVDAFAAWDKAEPGKGHDATGAEWQAKLEAK